MPDTENQPTGSTPSDSQTADQFRNLIASLERLEHESAQAATPAVRATFLEAVTAAIRAGIDEWNGEDSPERFAATAVLAMPEMQAIADVLYRLANGERKMDHGRRQLEIWGVPASFIDWTLVDRFTAGDGYPSR